MTSTRRGSWFTTGNGTNNHNADHSDIGAASLNAAGSNVFLGIDMAQSQRSPYGNSSNWPAAPASDNRHVGTASSPSMPAFGAVRPAMPQSLSTSAAPMYANVPYQNSPHSAFQLGTSASTSAVPQLRKQASAQSLRADVTMMGTGSSLPPSGYATALQSPSAMGMSSSMSGLGFDHALPGSSAGMMSSPAMRSPAPTANVLHQSQNVVEGNARMSYSPMHGNGGTKLPQQHGNATPSAAFGKLYDNASSAAMAQTMSSESGSNNPGLGLRRSTMAGQGFQSPRGQTQQYTPAPNGSAGLQHQLAASPSFAPSQPYTLGKSTSSGSILSISTSPTATGNSQAAYSPNFIPQLPNSASSYNTHGMDTSPAFRSPGFAHHQSTLAVSPLPHSNSNSSTTAHVSQGHAHTASQSSHGSAAHQSMRQQAQPQQPNPYFDQIAAGAQAMPSYGAYSPNFSVNNDNAQRVQQAQISGTPANARVSPTTGKYGIPPTLQSGRNGSVPFSAQSPVHAIQPQGSPAQTLKNLNRSQGHSRAGSAPGHRRRSTGSSFRKVQSPLDLKPGKASIPLGRRADPDGGVVSPVKALTTHLSQTYHLVNPNFRYEFSHNPRRVLTKPSKPAGNDGYDNDDCDYILYVNDVLGQEGNKYLILDVLGQGTFGQVVKCQNMKTHEIVGVKVIKNKQAYYEQSMMEIAILEMLNLNYDADDKHHILRLKDQFVHRRHLCLVFELLSSNLYELIKQNNFRGLSTSLVRVFTEQLLDALTVLKDARLIHCDLKPENILLKTLQSPDIKVIDFGSACHERQTVYTYIQSRFYRSPEVLFGLPYSTSIDMWSLGCICVELFLGLPIFPGTSEFNQVTRIVEMLGMPPTHMLENGKQVSHFFNIYVDEYGRKQWQLKTLEEYERDHPNAKEQPSKRFFAANTLPEIIKTYPNQRKGLKQTDLDRESHNRVSFIDFVSGLLNMNPMERWTPQQAKMHPFILNEPLRAPFVPPGTGSSLGHSRNSSHNQLQSSAGHTSNAERPYGGLPPTPQRANLRTYDAAAYQQHLNQQQLHSANAIANAYRQNTQASIYTSPHLDTSKAGMSQAFPAQRLPQASGSGAQRQQQGYHGPSQSVSYLPSSIKASPSGPLSPIVQTGLANPPAAHHYAASRGRAGTFSQLDVPPALQKLGIDLASFKSIGTPQLRRDEQRAAWERRHAAPGDQAQLDRRRSLHRQANPHLEHLEYYANTGHLAPGYYFAGPPMLQAMQLPQHSISQHPQQPFSIVVDPRMTEMMQQQQQQHAAAAASRGGYDMNPIAASVTVPPQAYHGATAARAYSLSQPMAFSHSAQQQGSLQGQGQVLGQTQSNADMSNMAFDRFDQFDERDGINTMLHAPMVPQQRQGAQISQMPYQSPGPTGFYNQPGQYANVGGISPNTALPFPGHTARESLLNGASNFLPSLTGASGKQRKSDAQLWP